MKAKGFGGALLVDANGANQGKNRDVPAGPTFGSPAWTALFTHALAEADRLGLEITLNITSGWNLGGPKVKPEGASKVLTYSRVHLHGGSPSHLLPPPPMSRDGFYRQIAVLAYPLAHGDALAAQPGNSPSAMTLRARAAAAELNFSMPDASHMLVDGTQGKGAQFAADPSYADLPLSGVINLTGNIAADGKLSWTPPPGEWEILRIGYTGSGAKVSTSSGAWQGLAIDYLSRAAFTDYWDENVEPLLRAAKPYHSLRYLATDSWELGGTNWTADFRQQFQKLRGYDPVPWLPVVAGRIVGDRAQSTRFLTDLRRTVADLVVSEHYDVFAEKAQEHGMGVQAESGGPHGAPLDGLETFRHSAVPQSEFWSQNPHRKYDTDRFFTKEAASAANIYGQRYVAQEGETSIGPHWSESLSDDLKPSFDMAITEGMNRLVWHEFTSSPASTGLPGQEYFAGTHLNPKITWWNAGGAFFTYLNRAQFLMQQGEAVNDVLYFYGDNVPNFARLKNDDPAGAIPGYDYDVTDEDALLHNLQVAGPDLIGPSGVRWHLLVLPKTRRVSFAVLELVDRYVLGGGSVAGLPPLSTTGRISPEEQARFDMLTAKVWSSCSTGAMHGYGSGHVFCGNDTHAALAALNLLPDFTLIPAAEAKPTSSSGIDYIHRRSGDTDIYFVRNASGTAVHLKAGFRVTGKHAELWDAVSGTFKPVSVREGAPGQVVVPLQLPAFGSVFVIFSSEFGDEAMPAVEHEVPLKLHGDWKLSFQKGRGGPSTGLTVSELKSWTESPDPAVRFFSGTVTYTGLVESPQGSHDHIALHFSSVREIARVRINGVDAGTVWARPYLLDVGRFLVPGTNKIEIEVTNLWANRLIGDLQPGVTTRITSTNINAYEPNSALLPSGLIGPITWIVSAP